MTTRCLPPNYSCYQYLQILYIHKLSIRTITVSCLIISSHYHLTYWEYYSVNQGLSDSPFFIWSIGGMSYNVRPINSSLSIVNFASQNFSNWSSSSFDIVITLLSSWILKILLCLIKTSLFQHSLYHLLFAYLLMSINLCFSMAHFSN